MKIIIKPVRRCKDCGHLVPLQRVNCPYCNGEILEFGDHSEKDVPLETTDYSFLKKYKWVALGGILALVVLVIFISALSGGKEDTSSAPPIVTSVSETYSGHNEGQASGPSEAKAVFDREYDASEDRNVETFEGYHTFSGHNGGKVRGEITVNGTEVTGRERYSSSYLPLSGYYDPESGRMEMTEYNGNMTTGTYEGTVDGMEFHGTFTNFKGRTYNATLYFQ